VGRWWSPDPWDQYHSVYNYVGNSPIYFRDHEGKGGVSFGVEGDIGIASFSYQIVLEFGSFNKFQIGILENAGVNKYDINGEAAPTGLNFGISANGTITFGTKNLNDWGGKSTEMEGPYFFSRATTETGISQFGAGYGPGFGSTLDQENFSRLSLDGIDVKRAVKSLISSMKTPFYQMQKGIFDIEIKSSIKPEFNECMNWGDFTEMYGNDPTQWE